MATLSISEARKKIFAIAEDVQKPDTHYTLTENGKPKVVVLSAEQYDSLMETLEMLSDPKAMARIALAEREYARGDYDSWEVVKARLSVVRARQPMVRDRGGKRYRTKSKKR